MRLLKLTLLIALVSTLVMYIAFDKARAISGSAGWHVQYDTPGAYVTGACVNSATCIAVGVEGYVAISNDSGATWVNQKILPYGSQLLGISCAGTLTCYAVGQIAGSAGVIVSTQNAGITWSSPVIENSASYLEGIYCVTTTTCWAVGSTGSAGVILATSDGTTWNAQVVPSGIVSLAAISCYGTTSCTAVGQGLISGSMVGIGAATSNGINWTLISMPSSTSLTSISCVGTSCQAGGYSGGNAVLFGSSNGTSFSAESVPFGPVAVNGLSCYSATSCVAVDSDGFVIYTNNLGAAWQLATSAPALVSGYFGIVCLNTASCIAFGQELSGVAIFVDISLGASGPAFQNVAVSGDTSFLSVSCFSQLDCVAVGDSSAGAITATTSTAGASWNIQPAPGNVADLLAVGCYSNGFCLAGGDAGAGGAVMLLTTNGGASWAAAGGTLSSSLVAISSIDCVSNTTCIAADLSGNVAVTSNAGQSFNVVSTNLSSSGGELFAVSCSSATFCIAAGNSGPSNSQAVILTSTNAGSSWNLGFETPSATAFYAASCSGGDCYAGGSGSGGAVMFVYNGSVWASSALPAGLFGIQGLSCASSSDCSAVDISGQVVNSSNQGGSWQIQSGPFNVESLSAVSCYDAIQCTAVGADVILSSIPTVSSVTPGSGSLSGGQSVVIEGSGFTGATGVSFGTNAATFSVVNDTTIDATVPATSNPGIVNVVVTTSSGASPQTLVDGYLYTNPGPYTPTPPERICDTRPGTNDPATYAGDTLGPGQVLNVAVTNNQNDQVPQNATAVVLNITAVYPSTYGFLTVYPTGLATPLASTLNFSPGEVAVANLTEIPLGLNGQISVYNAFGVVNVLVDVEGYVGPSSNPTAGLYNPVAPQRVADTRAYSGNNYQDAGQYVLAGQSITVNFSGVAGLPTSGIGAVVVNITAVNGSAAGGYLVAYPSGSLMPSGSTVNFGFGEAVANRAEVQVSNSQSITITVENADCNVIVDVNGYYTAGLSGQTGYNFEALSPTRIVDTRQYSNYQLARSTLQSGVSQNFAVAGYGSDEVPSNAAAVVGNATTTNTSSNGGYLVLYPQGGTLPQTSDLNWNQGQTIANMAAVKLGSGNLSVAAYNSSADFIFDVTGWFA
jgi:hypothetical protein